MEASLPIVPEIKYSLGLIWGQWKMHEGLLKKYCLIMCEHCFGLACQYSWCNADSLYILCSLAYWHFEKKSLYITLITRSFSALSWPLLSEHWYWHFKLSLMHLYRLNLKCEHWMRQKANPLLLQNVTVADMDMTVLRWFYVLDASLHNSKHAAHIFIFLRFFFFDIA